MLSESLIYFNKNNLANFYIRKLQRIFPSCRFFENTRKKTLVESRSCTGPRFLFKRLYRWFSPYVIAAMLVDGKQKIAH